MEDIEAQKDEILALQSILDENQIRVDAANIPITGSIFVKPEITSKLVIVANQRLDAQSKVTVCHLMPFEIQFSLPNNYPSYSAPIFTLICNWLKREELSKLCSTLDKKWENDYKGEVILYEWIQFLQCQALEFLGITDTLDVTWFYHRQKLNQMHEAKEDYCPSPLATHNHVMSKIDSRAIHDIPYSSDILHLLKEYDIAEEQSLFEKMTHLCKVCFSSKLGIHCMKFENCDHVYCKECMKGYFEVKISDGAVKNMNCPDDKCTSQALPYQVKELVNQEMYSRYDSLLLESSIASMMNLTYCPRPKCQYPVFLENDTGMGSCPMCHFHFCLLCKAAFHGVAPCKFSTGDKLKLYESYVNGTDSEKEELENRYGKKQLLALVDDVLTAEWLEKQSKQCPHCNTPIEKKDGCNKMSCLRCNTYFCWLCLAQLNPRHPYLHFSDPSSKCNLFEGLIQENDDNENDWHNIDIELDF